MTNRPWTPTLYDGEPWLHFVANDLTPAIRANTPGAARRHPYRTPDLADPDWFSRATLELMTIELGDEQACRRSNQSSSALSTTSNIAALMFTQFVSSPWWASFERWQPVLDAPSGVRRQVNWHRRMAHAWPHTNRYRYIATDTAAKLDRQLHGLCVAAAALHIGGTAGMQIDAVVNRMPLGDVLELPALLSI